MYRCGLCGVCSPPRQSRRLHVVHRTVPAGRQHHVVRDHNGQPRSWVVFTPERTEVAREVPICVGCEEELARRARSPASTPQAYDPLVNGRVAQVSRPGSI